MFEQREEKEEEVDPKGEYGNVHPKTKRPLLAFPQAARNDQVKEGEESDNQDHRHRPVGGKG